MAAGLAGEAAAGGGAAAGAGRAEAAAGPGGQRGHGRTARLGHGLRAGETGAGQGGQAEGSCGITRKGREG